MNCLDHDFGTLILNVEFGHRCRKKSALLCDRARCGSWPFTQKEEKGTLVGFLTAPYQRKAYRPVQVLPPLWFARQPFLIDYTLAELFKRETRRIPSIKVLAE